MVLPPAALLKWQNFGGKLDFGGNSQLPGGGVSIVNMMHREVFMYLCVYLSTKHTHSAA